jgi:hypothetical protein
MKRYPPRLRQFAKRLGLQPTSLFSTTRLSRHYVAGALGKRSIPNRSKIDGCDACDRRCRKR